MAEEFAGAPIGVDVGGVGDVVALALEEPHYLDLPRERGLTIGGGKGSLERDVIRRPSGAVRRVEALSAPVVIGLPRVDRGLDEDGRRVPR